MPLQGCSYCDRQFTRTEHLLRHVRSHTKEKPFKCRICGKSYVRDDTLRRHVKSHVEGEADGRPDHGSSARPWTNNGVASPVERMPAESIPPSKPSSSSDLSDGSPQAQQMSTETLASILLQTPENFEPSGNLWDLGSIPFPDDVSLWSFNSNFWMNAVGMDPILSQAHQEQMPSPRCTTDICVSTAASSSESARPSAVSDLSHLWLPQMHSRLDISQRLQVSSPARTPSSYSGDPTHIDEQYRRDLTKAFITQPSQEFSLPSSEFLNLCVRRYFKCFNHLFPIIHSATFRPTPENGLLLLSIASVGALFLGSQSAVRHGSRLFKRLNKAIVANWDHILHRGNREILAMIQASLIGQTFALLSGDPRYFAIFDAYHGSVISFARREKLLEVNLPSPQYENLEGPDLEIVWETWARREELRRISLALQIHDAELTALQHTDPLLRQFASKRPTPSSSRVFSANTAAEWAAALREETTAKVLRRGDSGTYAEDPFNAYLILEGLGVKISEHWRDGALDHTVFAKYQDALLRWHESYTHFLKANKPDQLYLMILWHWTYMNLLVDFDQLERAIGRNGPDAARDAIGYVIKWVSSPNSKRCILHAFLLQKRLQSSNFDEIPAIHVPRTLFSAAIAWHCYVQYGRHKGTLDATAGPWKTDFPELIELDPNAQCHLSYIAGLCGNNYDKSSVQAATLCEIGYLLQRMNQWGIARKFADIVACLVGGGLEDI